jgi:hypothetical protein
MDTDRRAARSEVYRDALSDSISRFADWYHRLDEHERDEVVRQARERLAEAADG